MAVEWSKFKTPTVVIAAKISAGIVLLAAISTVAYNGVGLWDRLSPPSEKSSPGESTGLTPSAGAGPSVVAGPAVPVAGACVEGDREVSCELVHEYQVISGADEACGVGELLNFFGGTANVDSILPSLVTSWRGFRGVDVCVVSVTELTGSGSLRDALLSSHGDLIRWCIDLAGRDAGCSSIHSAEVVYSDSSAGAGVDCEQKFQDYVASMDRRLLLDLKVTPRRFGDSFQCLATVRGEYALEGSLRRLGDNALPIRDSNR